MRNKSKQNIDQITLPALDATLERYLMQVRAWNDEKMYGEAQSACYDFARGAAFALHDALTLHAAAVLPQNWDEEVRVENQLKNGASLPLSSNISAQIKWQATQSGLKRVAFFVQALLQVHQSYLQNNLSQALANIAITDYDAARWRVLAGASRRLQRGDEDGYLFNDKRENLNSHLVVLFQGRAFLLEVIDAQGDIANHAQIERALAPLLDADIEPDVAFAAISVLPREDALKVRELLNWRDENSKIWGVLEKALFVLSINDTHQVDESHALAESIFGDGSAVWAYKPMNYICFIKDDRYYIHFEKSYLSLTIVDQMLSLAQYYYWNGTICRRNKLDEMLSCRCLNWIMESRTCDFVKERLSNYQRTAEKKKVTICDVFLNENEFNTIKEKGSDALIQLAIQYAQQQAFAKIAIIYEGIGDFPEHNGNHNGVRPVTIFSQRAIFEMMRSPRSGETIDNYINDHERQLSRAQQGLGIDRHLIGLQFIASAQDLQESFFSSNSFLRWNQNSINTSSFTNRKILDKVSFAPNGTQGLAIDYLIYNNNIRFVITHERIINTAMTQFCRALIAGIKQTINYYHQ